MKCIKILLIFFLGFINIVLGQGYNIYGSDKPDIVPIWHRVADYAPVLRSVEAARLSPDGRLAVSASKFGYNLMVCVWLMGLCFGRASRKLRLSV